jgi:outer membrane lipoprotein-sorting protein
MRLNKIFMPAFCIAGLIFAADFTGDLIVTDNGKIVVKGKVIMSKDKMRQEISSGEMDQVIIVRMDKKVIWMLMPDSKMYMEMPLGNDLEQAGIRQVEEWTPEMEKKSKPAGSEKIGPYDCKKFELSNDEGTLTYWVSATCPVPIKCVFDKTVIEYKNIETKPVAASLFEVPSGFSVMGMPGMMPGMTPGPSRGNNKGINMGTSNGGTKNIAQ